MVRFPAGQRPSPLSQPSMCSPASRASRARPGRWQDRLIRAHGSRPGPASGRAYPALSDFHCCGEHLSGVAAAEVGCLGGFDFRLSESGASARLRLRLSGRLAGPPGGGRKPAGLHREREASESLWVALETARGGRLDLDSDCRTTGSRATTGSPPRGSASLAGAGSFRPPCWPVWASRPPAGLASFGSVSRDKAAWSVH